MNDGGRSRSLYLVSTWQEADLQHCGIDGLLPILDLFGKVRHALGRRLDHRLHFRLIDEGGWVREPGERTPKCRQVPIAGAR